jgi:hypothetical protein
MVSPRDAELMEEDLKDPEGIEDLKALDEPTDEEAEDPLDPVDQDGPDGLGVEAPDPTLFGTTKVCTVWVPGVWRDSS